MENNLYDDEYRKSQQEAYINLQQQLQDSIKQRELYKKEKRKSAINFIACLLTLFLFPVPWLMLKPEVNAWDLWFLSREQREFAKENLQSFPPFAFPNINVKSERWLDTVGEAVQNMPTEYDGVTNILIDVYPTNSNSKLTQQQTISLSISTSFRNNITFGTLTIKSADTLIGVGIPEELQYNIYQEIQDGTIYSYISKDNGDNWYYIAKSTTKEKTGYDFLPLVKSIKPYRGEWTKEKYYYSFWRMYSNTTDNPYGACKESISFWLSEDNYLNSMHRDVINLNLQKLELDCLAQGSEIFNKMRQDNVGLVDMMSYDFEVGWWELFTNYTEVPSIEKATKVDNFDFLYDDIINLLQRSENYTAIGLYKN